MRHLQLDQGAQGREGLGVDGADGIPAQVPVGRAWDRRDGDPRRTQCSQPGSAFTYPRLGCPQEQCPRAFEKAPAAWLPSWLLPKRKGCCSLASEPRGPRCQLEKWHEKPSRWGGTSSVCVLGVGPWSRGAMCMSPTRVPGV